jgi:cell division protein FtsB
MKETDTRAAARIEELRQRLEKIDAERTAVSAELRRLTDPNSAQATAHSAQKDPILGSAQKDWHVFAGPPKHKMPKPKAVD